MANWSDLHHDLLVRIARRVSLIEDFVAFGCVCHSWRLAATKQNFTTTKSLSQVPWLMLANDDAYNNSRPHREFYSLLQDRSFKITFPESNGKRCFSSQGWIFTIGKDEEINLLHPLSRSQIRLPHLRTFSYLQSHPELRDTDIYTDFIRKVVLSASPSSTSDYVVMVIYTGFVPQLAFYRAGDDKWTSIDTYFSMYMDVIHCSRNKFYALDNQGRVLICDVDGPNPTTAEVVSFLPIGSIPFIQKLYLVESSSSGKLLIVSRDGVEADEYGKYGATRFQLFEMNDSDNKWEEVNNIGDEALFLGDNSSFSIDVYGFGFGCSVCKPNCIYFTDDCSDSYQQDEDDNEVITLEGGTDMGVYNLLDGTIEPHFKGESYSRIAPPLWVVPTF